jgi:hypothetical protein
MNCFDQSHVCCIELTREMPQGINALILLVHRGPFPRDLQGEGEAWDLPLTYSAARAFNRCSGAAMKNDQKDFPLLERLMVVAILLVVAVIGIEDLLHSVKQSEEHTVLAAAAEYSALRNMYAEQYRPVPSGAFGVNTTGTANPFNTPVR